MGSRTRRRSPTREPPARPTRDGPARVDGPLPRAFYLRPAPVVARALLGCVLVSRVGGALAAGRIVETEAYLGPEDRASHAAFRPSSHPLFYGPGGIAYIFRAYGLHHCLNAIAGRAGTPGCVLIRALEPTRGLALMARRRRVPQDAPMLTDGPGKLTQALGLSLRENGLDLTRGRLVILPPVTRARPRVAVGPRIGIRRGRDLALRFWLRDSLRVSRFTGRRRRRAVPA